MAELNRKMCLERQRHIEADDVAKSVRVSMLDEICRQELEMSRCRSRAMASDCILDSGRRQHKIELDTKEAILQSMQLEIDKLKETLNESELALSNLREERNAERQAALVIKTKFPAHVDHTNGYALPMGVTVKVEDPVSLIPLPPPKVPSLPIVGDGDDNNDNGDVAGCSQPNTTSVSILPALKFELDSDSSDSAAAGAGKLVAKPKSKNMWSDIESSEEDVFMDSPILPKRLITRRPKNAFILSSDDEVMEDKSPVQQRSRGRPPKAMPFSNRPVTKILNVMQSTMFSTSSEDEPPMPKRALRGPVKVMPTKPPAKPRITRASALAMAGSSNATSAVSRAAPTKRRADEVAPATKTVKPGIAFCPGAKSKLNTRIICD